MTNIDITPEFSRMILLSNIGIKDGLYDFEANSEECEALARRFGLKAISLLKAHVRVEGLKRQEYRLVINLRADIIQTCGITTEDMSSKINEDFSIKLVREEPEEQREEQDIVFDHDDEDIEVMTSDHVDVGELIAQHLSLFIDPYPKKENANKKLAGHVILEEGDECIEEKRPNPFNVLKSLKH